ncbi:endonuclease domain-containing protein [Sphingobium boeckii]|uniref:Very-short-patch-repair endonuclease n=1 Tax=Sphingobium boeckii TaxID=1082345 RepID=A0A7W9EGB9_9SPHN|nr:endonuclease domain-containing protein [Sphingobium boeckii]MBB5686945.1 very-short-patch-repair endonuclease [Sphingobium boeckii]
MRCEPTEPELRLWLQLRAKRFNGIKFRKQKVVGPYIADFSAREPMLVIELDGDSHGERHDYDLRRTQFFEKQGYQVVRFTNADVLGNLEGVLESLMNLTGTAPLPTLSPNGERTQ